MELYKIKTPHTCVVCKTHLIEKFEVAFPVVHNTGRRIYGGVTPESLRQRRAERLASWYPKSLGIMCPKCEIKYEKKSMGYTIEQVKERMNFISFTVKEVLITNLETYKTKWAIERDVLFDRSLTKKEKKNCPASLLSYFKQNKQKVQNSSKKIVECKFTGILWMKNPILGTFGDALFFPLTYSVPKDKVLVLRNMEDKEDELFVIPEKVIKKLKSQEEGIIEIPTQKKKTKKAV